MENPGLILDEQKDSTPPISFGLREMQSCGKCLFVTVTLHGTGYEADGTQAERNTGAKHQWMQAAPFGAIIEPDTESGQ
jgi:hypothetical protein